MSAAGQILAQVEEFVQGLLARVHSHDEEQDKRLDQIEERLDALETPPPSATVKPAARTATARAGAAGVKAEAKDSK
jgi:pantothenate kinase